MAGRVSSLVFGTNRGFYKEEKNVFPNDKRRDVIPALYKIAKSRKMPMTKLVNKIVEEYLEKNTERRVDQKVTVVSGNG